MLSPLPSFARETELMPAFSLKSFFSIFFVNKHLPEFIVADAHIGKPSVSCDINNIVAYIYEGFHPIRKFLIYEHKSAVYI